MTENEVTGGNIKAEEPTDRSDFRTWIHLGFGRSYLDYVQSGRLPLKLYFLSSPLG